MMMMMIDDVESTAGGDDDDCQFSKCVSFFGGLTCDDASRLTRCHRALVSNSCHFSRTPPPSVGDRPNHCGTRTISLRMFRHATPIGCAVPMADRAALTIIFYRQLTTAQYNVAQRISLPTRVHSVVQAYTDGCQPAVSSIWMLSGSLRTMRGPRAVHDRLIVVEVLRVCR